MADRGYSTNVNIFFFSKSGKVEIHYHIILLIQSEMVILWIEIQIWKELLAID